MLAGVVELGGGDESGDAGAGAVDVVAGAVDVVVGAVDVAAGAAFDDAPVAGVVVDVDGLEFDAGAELGAELTGGVTAEALGPVAGSDEVPEEPPPHDAHSRAAIMIATARMGSLLPIPARWSWHGPRSWWIAPQQG